MSLCDFAELALAPILFPKSAPRRFLSRPLPEMMQYQLERDGDAGLKAADFDVFLAGMCAAAADGANADGGDTAGQGDITIG